eukprot:332816-Rhodomonas_salina.1
MKRGSCTESNAQAAPTCLDVSQAIRDRNSYCLLHPKSRKHPTRDICKVLTQSFRALNVSRACPFASLGTKGEICATDLQVLLFYFALHPKWPENVFRASYPVGVGAC